MLVPTAQWRRLSPRMLLVHPVIEVGKALPAIVGVFLAGRSGGDGSSGSRWSLLIAGIVIGFSLLRWFTTRYRITDEQIQLRKGLLRRRTLAASTDRVRTVDVTAHLLHRVLGLARVIVGTGTSDRKGRDRIVLDGLTAAAAAALRSELLHRGDATPTPTAVAPTEQELARVQTRWLRYAPYSLTGAAAGLALLGFGWRLVNESHVDLRTLTLYRVVADQLARWPLGLDVVTSVAFVLAFLALASTVGYVLSFWNFRLTRHSGGTLHVSRGLITTRATSIERRRLLGAELTEPLLLRAVGGAGCQAIATGLRVGRGSERGGEVLLPPAPREVAVRVAAAVLGTATGGTGAPFAAVLAPHPPAARRRRIGRALAGALVIAAGIGALVWLAGWPTWLWSLAVLPVAAAVPLGLDRYRSLGHATIDGFVVTSYGSLVRRRCVLAADGVIGWNIRSSLFQRRVGLATLVATTAAGRQSYRIADLASADAVRYADAVRPGLLTQFLE